MTSTTPTGNKSTGTGIPPGFWHDNGDGTAWLLSPVDETRYDRACSNCQGWTRFENDGKHCDTCDDTGRLTTNATLDVADQPNWVHKRPSTWTADELVWVRHIIDGTPASRPVRIQIIEGTVAPVVAFEDCEDNTHHICRNETWSPTGWIHHLPLDTEGGATETFIELGDDAEVGMWACKVTHNLPAT